MTSDSANAPPLAPPVLLRCLIERAHKGVRAAGRARLRGRSLYARADNEIL